MLLLHRLSDISQVDIAYPGTYYTYVGGEKNHATIPYDTSTVVRKYLVNKTSSDMEPAGLLGRRERSFIYQIY